MTTGVREVYKGARVDQECRPFWPARGLGWLAVRMRESTVVTWVGDLGEAREWERDWERLKLDAGEGRRQRERESGRKRKEPVIGGRFTWSGPTSTPKRPQSVCFLS